MNVALLPWPDKLLSPNARVHHMVKARAVRSSRNLAMFLGRQHPWNFLYKPVCAVLPITPTRRRRDIDNVLAGLKSALDGLTDTGWWKDDSDIVSISIRRPIYLKGWGKEPILFVAAEYHDEDKMLACLRRFVREMDDGDPQAFEHLLYEAKGRYDQR